MIWFLRVLVFVPVVFLVMVVYVAPQATDARGVVRLAIKKAAKVLAWTLALVVGMLLIEQVLLP